MTDLPPGEGQSLVMDVCVRCHSLETSLVERKDQTGWQKTVNDMILRGAFITPEEAKTIIAYLTKTRGRVDLNRVSLEELLRVTPLQPAEAEAILRYRSHHGHFRSLDELQEVEELTPERIEEIKRYFSVTPVSSSSDSESKPNSN